MFLSRISDSMIEFLNLNIQAIEAQHHVLAFGVRCMLCVSKVSSQNWNISYAFKRLFHHSVRLEVLECMIYNKVSNACGYLTITPQLFCSKVHPLV